MKDLQKVCKIIREEYNNTMDVAYFLYIIKIFGGVVAAIDRGMKIL